MPKAKEKSIIPEEEEEATLHGTVNPEEARRHAINLDKAMDIIEDGIKTGINERIMENTIKKIKAALVEITPHMEEAKIVRIKSYQGSSMHSTGASRQ